MTQPLDADSAHDADTIEMELSAEQLFALTQAVAPDKSELVAAPPPEAAQAVPTVRAAEVAAAVPESSPAPRGRPVASIVTIAAAAIAVSVVAYLATTRKPPPLHVAARTVSVSPAPEPAAQPAPQSVPVIFRNPFDAAEVFEFPSGTSKTEARDAVAQILLERARERQMSRAKPTPTTIASNKLVQRD